MQQLALYLLGPPRVELNDEPVHIGRRKALALLAYLVVTRSDRGLRHSRDSLAALLWPEHDHASARAELRRSLSVLKKTLDGEWLTADQETIGLNPDASLWLDMEHFHSLTPAWRGHGHPETDVCPRCLPPLTEAVELFRGDFLAGFTLRDSPDFDDWQFFQTQGLRDELAGVLERLAHGHCAQGELDLAIGHARRWVALDPLHEPAHRLLMRLYAQADQRAAALREFGECERLLKEELGVPPEEETKQLYQAIKEKREISQPVGCTVLPVSQPLPHRIYYRAAQLTPFIERGGLLAEIATHLQDSTSRLLTLVGAGGSGKTRLALEAASDQTGSFEQGVYFASLGPLQSVESIVPTVAEALGITFQTAAGVPAGFEARKQLLAYLRQKNVLIIMDNYEHLLEGADLVTDILAAAPNVQILVTSRARLNVQGEHLLNIAGMEVPDWDSTDELFEHTVQYSVVKLFLQCARQAQPSFALTQDNLADVVHICHQVEGMPLGVLLAASWVGVLTPAEIRAEISRSFDFLEIELRDIPERQRSMRAVFDHSWNLLTTRQQAIMKALSSFRGGFTRQAAEQVTGVTLPEMRALVDRSLIQREPGPAGRYQIHELLRQYAADKLAIEPAEMEKVKNRHCSFYTHFLQQKESHLLGREQQRELMKIEAEIDNVRIAWNWAVSRGRIENINLSLDSLSEFYSKRARNQEGLQVCAMAAQKLIQMQPTITKRRIKNVYARVISRQGRFSSGLGQVERGKELMRKSLAIFRDLDMQREIADSLCHLAYVSSPNKERVSLVEEAVNIFQELGEQNGLVSAFHLQGRDAMVQGEYEKARQLYQARLAITREKGIQDGIAHSLCMLGSTAWVVGEYRQAEQLYQESLALYREIDNQAGIALNLTGLGRDAMGMKAFGDAEQLIKESLAICQEFNLTFNLGYALESLARVAHEMGEYTKAIQFAQECIEDSRSLPIPFWAALAFGVLGDATKELNDLGRSRNYYRQALEMAMPIGAKPAILLTLVGIANQLAIEGDKGKSLELLILVVHHPASWQWTKDKAMDHIAELEIELSPEVVATAQERGQGLNLEPILAELLAELTC